MEEFKRRLQEFWHTQRDQQTQLQKLQGEQRNPYQKGSPQVQKRAVLKGREHVTSANARSGAMKSAEWTLDFVVGDHTHRIRSVSIAWGTVQQRFEGKVCRWWLRHFFPGDWLWNWENKIDTELRPRQIFFSLRGSVLWGNEDGDPVERSQNCSHSTRSEKERLSRVPWGVETWAVCPLWCGRELCIWEWL